MKALEIAKKIDEYVRDYGCSNGTINLLDDLIDELNQINFRSCDNCKIRYCSIKKILVEKEEISTNYFNCNDWE